MSDFNANIIQSKIDYVFENQSLLKLAFTHSSYANENKVASNEKLEFLGDSILNFCIAEYLFRKGGGDEGILSVMRSKIVSEPPLARCVETLGITQFLICGVGEQRNNPHKSDAVMADLFEAVVGAIYLDSGDIRACEAFILRHLKDAVTDAIDGKKPQKFTFKIIEKAHTDEHDYHGGNAVKKPERPGKTAAQPKALIKHEKPPVPEKRLQKQEKLEKKQKLKEEKQQKLEQQKQKKPKPVRTGKQGRNNAPHAAAGDRGGVKTADAPRDIQEGGVVDYKSALQNYLQREKLQKPEYMVTGQAGSAHDPIFNVAVYIGGKEYGSGAAGRKKDAEQAAAKNAFEAINALK